MPGLYVARMTPRMHGVSLWTSEAHVDLLCRTMSQRHANRLEKPLESPGSVPSAACTLLMGLSCFGWSTQVKGLRRARRPGVALRGVGYRGCARLETDARDGIRICVLCALTFCSSGLVVGCAGSGKGRLVLRQVTDGLDYLAGSDARQRARLHFFSVIRCLAPLASQHRRGRPFALSISSLAGTRLWATRIGRRATTA